MYLEGINSSKVECFTQICLNRSGNSLNCKFFTLQIIEMAPTVTCNLFKALTVSSVNVS